MPLSDVFSLAYLAGVAFTTLGHYRRIEHRIKKNCRCDRTRMQHFAEKMHHTPNFFTGVIVFTSCFWPITVPAIPIEHLLKRKYPCPDCGKRLWPKEAETLAERGIV